MDCWGCRTASARFCTACVQQATAERQRGLADYANENGRLVRIMKQGLEDRARTLSQSEAQRLHSDQMVLLAAELATVRREADQQAIMVNELRHAVRRTSSRFARTKAAAAESAAPTSPGAVGHYVVSPGAAATSCAACDGCARGESSRGGSLQVEAEGLRRRLSERRRELLRDVLAWAAPPTSSPWRNPSGPEATPTGA